ncbi:hypothetical protein CUMW_272910 [Citrus unshiu]|uniref:Uncharacterized protein n=1 Tax=Citrus unshiu TaxID=55188 RepID=A0A2H5MX80_CITUN|nr:hypothetical protein CUMW_272910 [Citrus unshiu]
MLPNGGLDTGLTTSYLISNSTAGKLRLQIQRKFFWHVPGLGLDFEFGPCGGYLLQSYKEKEIEC